MRDIERLLVVLKYHRRKIVGRTRFQKIVFLLKHKYGIDFSYNFIPYYYGPYSQELQFEINMLSLIDAIEIGSVCVPYSHILTEKGLETAERVEREMKPSEQRRLIEAIKEIRKKPTYALVAEAKRLAGQA